MKNILNYFLTVLILLSLPKIVHSQDSTWVRGIRLGCDLSRFVLPFTQPDRKAAIEFSIDTEWKPKFFPTAELGFENVKISNENIGYKSNSIYARIGFDKNILKNDNNRHADMFFIGYRYGISVINQEVYSFSINDTLWGNVNGSYPAKIMQHHWLEFVAGTRAALNNVIFMGFSARVRLKVYSQKDINFPFVVPGFGSGEKKMTIGFNYSIYFQVPVKKVKIKN